MAENDADKSFEATPHRRQQAREQGQVAHSQDLASSALLLAGLLALWMFAGGLIHFLGGFTRQQLGGAAWLSADADWAVHQWWRIVVELGRYVLPILGLLLVGGVVAHLFQVGFLFLPNKLLPDINRVNPLQGFSRIFSLANVMRLVFGLLKMVAIGTVAYYAVRGEYGTIIKLTDCEPGEIATYLLSTLFWVSLKIAVALVSLAVLDYLFQWWKHERDIRMTTQEMREEMKNLEGDPHIASRRKAVQRQLALNRMAAAVPKADAVITNPTELAIAIQYDPETMAAPVVVAKGAGLVAERIRRIALEHGVPIVERKPLAQALFREVEVNQPVPQDKYAAVAEVLAYVYQLKGKPIPTPR